MVSIKKVPDWNFQCQPMRKQKEKNILNKGVHPR